MVLSETYPLASNQPRIQWFERATIYLALKSAIWKCRLGSTGWFFWSQLNLLKHLRSAESSVLVGSLVLHLMVFYPPAGWPGLVHVLVAG